MYQYLLSIFFPWKEQNIYNSIIYSINRITILGQSGCKQIIDSLPLNEEIGRVRIRKGMIIPKPEQPLYRPFPAIWTMHNLIVDYNIHNMIAKRMFYRCTWMGT